MRLPFVCLVLMCALSSISFGQITFSSSKAATTGDSFVATGDFNRDGIPDLAVARFGGGVNILLGHADGSYSSFSDITAGSSVNQIAVADVNRDGKLDLLLNFGDGGVGVLLGNGDGTFIRSADVTVTFQAAGIAVADFNNDGFVDLAVHECQEVQNPFCVVDIFLNDHTGHFVFSNSLTPVSSNSGNRNAMSIAAADLNSDRKQDLVFLDVDGFEVALGNGGGNFLTPIFTSLVNPDSVLVGSFNHDLKLDLAIRTTDDCIGCTQPPTHVSVYLNDGTGHFGLRSRLAMGTTDSFGVAQAALMIADLNGDRIADLVTTSDNTGNVQYALGHGDGTFAAPVQVAHITNASWAAARDLNRDGRHDLVISSGTDGFVHILKNTNATVNCTPRGSGSEGVHFCSPKANQITAKTFTVSAAGNSPAGLTRLELWIDGKKRTEVQGDQLRNSVTVAAGKHRVAVVAVDITGTTTSAVSITAQ